MARVMSSSVTVFESHDEGQLTEGAFQTPPQVLELASERVFVPLTVGGGIRSHTDDTGKVSWYECCDSTWPSRTAFSCSRYVIHVTAVLFLLCHPHIMVLLFLLSNWFRRSSDSDQGESLPSVLRSPNP